MYVRVHACSKQCRACNHPHAHPLPFLRPTTPVAPSSSTSSATILTVPHQPLPLPIRSTTHIARLFLPWPPPVTHSSPSQLCEHGVTASTIRHAHHHPLLSPITYAILLFPYVPFSFPFCFHFRLPQTPDPIHPAGKTVRCRKYGNTGAVSQRECDNTKNFD